MKIEVDVAALEGLVRESERMRAAMAYAQKYGYEPCKNILPILGAEAKQAAGTPEDDF